MGEKKFRSYVENRLEGRVDWKFFVPPWDMPRLLNTIDALFHFEQNLPSSTFSYVALDALYCGLTVVVDSPGFLQRYKNHGLSISQIENLVVEVLSGDPSEAAITITNLMKNSNRQSSFCKNSDYLEYVNSNENALLSVIKT